MLVATWLLVRSRALGTVGPSGRVWICHFRSVSGERRFHRRTTNERLRCSCRRVLDPQLTRIARRYYSNASLSDDARNRARQVLGPLPSGRAVSDSVGRSELHDRATAAGIEA